MKRIAPAPRPQLYNGVCLRPACAGGEELLMGNFKHLNIDERYAIQRGMDGRKTFKAVGREISRDCRTVAREVLAHRSASNTGGSGRHFNDCANRFDCTVTKLKIACRNKKRCCFCFECCSSACGEYSREVCPKLQTPPYCCNSCGDKPRCTLTKMFYRAANADRAYREHRSEINKGLFADEDEILRIDRIVSPLIYNGHSIHHICINHSDEIMLSEKTLYSYAEMGLFEARNIDMPRKVRYKIRKCNHASFKVDKKCRIGRTYEDMNRFIRENDPAVVEMDTVEGKKGGKVLLTVFFTVAHLMLAFIRDANTALSVKDIFAHLYHLLGRGLFIRLFPMLRTDNGSEFSDPVSLEFDDAGNRRTWVFFCESNSSWQKSGCELNHEYIRRIIPKGHSMDDLLQDDIQLMMDHINSYKRKGLGDKSPYELFVAVYGQEPADKLNLTLIEPDKIILKPKLLKKNS
jgi:IS30 family transposase